MFMVKVWGYDFENICGSANRTMTCKEFQLSLTHLNNITFNFDCPSRKEEKKNLSRVEKRSFTLCAPFIVRLTAKSRRRKKRKIRVGNFHGHVQFFPHVCLCFLCRQRHNIIQHICVIATPSVERKLH
jgi:hypothetical protein